MSRHWLMEYVEAAFPWVLVLAVAGTLSYFWALIFLTFILATFMGSLVNRVKALTGLSRGVILSATYLALITMLGLVIARVVPVASREASEINEVYLPRAITSAQAFLKERVGSEGTVHKLVGQGLESVVKQHSSQALSIPKILFGGLFRIVLFLILSIVFSFLILIDPPSLAHEFSRVRHTRVGWIYDRIVPPLVEFFTIVGKVFDAQIIIALLNTTLTGLGMIALGISNALFLSMIVFFCGLIPVLGVFLSSTPILLVALLQENGGVVLASKGLAMVLGVHALEAYVLNPRIMGDHLKVHPFTVLLTLLLGEHYFGLWGVLMGVPIVTYVWHRVHEAAQRFGADPPQGAPGPRPAPETREPVLAEHRPAR